MRRAWLIAVVAACAGERDVPPDTAHSGTRLKLGWFVFDSGLRTWSMDIVDRELGLPCTPTEWHDGALRCTPPGLPPVAYLDARCSEPATLDTDTPYAISKVSRCGTERPDRWFEATGDVISVSVAYGPNLSTGVACESIFSRTGSLRLRRAVARSPQALVALRRVYQGEGRLRIETLSSPDGLLVPVQPYDAELDAACLNFDNRVFNTNGMGDLTSVPCVLDAFETEQYGDAACQLPAAVLHDASCPAPETAAGLDLGPCRPYFAVSDEPAAAVFQGSGFGGSVTTCSPLDDVPGRIVYPSTQQLEPLTFTRAVQPGDGRVQLIYLGDGETRIRERTIFYDAELETECSLYPGPDTFDCLPVERASGTSTAYTDDACTRPVFVTWINDRDDTLWPCMQYRPRKYASDGARTVRAIGPAQLGPLYWIFDGTCRPVDVRGATAYSLGSPIEAPPAHATQVFDP